MTLTNWTLHLCQGVNNATNAGQAGVDASTNEQILEAIAKDLEKVGLALLAMSV